MKISTALKEEGENSPYSSKRIGIVWYGISNVALTVLAILYNASWQVIACCLGFPMIAVLVFAGYCTKIDLQKIIAGAANIKIGSDDNHDDPHSPTEDNR